MLHKLCSLNDINIGELKTFEVAGKKITLARTSEQDFFAIDDACTHEECSLGEGFLDDTTLTCPCHGAQFDVTNGHVLTLPAVKNVIHYKLEIKERLVLIHLSNDT